jgi:hypothetical protein
MGVSFLGELTSRICSPLKLSTFISSKGRDLSHSNTASYCRQIESSAAPLATYMCMPLTATFKVTSVHSVVTFEVTCSKKWCPARVCVNGCHALIFLVVAPTQSRTEQWLAA